MIEQLATGFERKILFGFGRHFWNAIGIAGLIAICTGTILWVEGIYGEPKSFGKWLKSEYPSIGNTDSADRYILKYEKLNSRSCEERKRVGLPCDKMSKMQMNLLRVLRNKYYLSEYEAYVFQDDLSRDARVYAAPIAISSGVGTLATVSIISAVLAV